VHPADGSVIALGSGGSERIRSTLTRLLTALLDEGLDLAAAVRAPRLHWDRSTLQVEPGLPPAALALLRRRWPVAQWAARDLYFGGAHVASRRPDGTGEAVGDERRDGHGIVLPASPRGVHGS
jgi:gamma-glutamyltranspeptidase/glutathione hydrolase